MRKGSKEAKAWGAKMRRLRGTQTRKKSTRRKTRKTTTRRRRTTRKDDLTLRRTKAYRRSTGATMKSRLDSAFNF